MRFPILLAVMAVAAPIGLCAGSAVAQSLTVENLLFGRTRIYQGPWCAHDQSAADRVEEICSFDSFEDCRRAIVSGNFGFCTQNPAFAGYREEPPRRKRRARR